jgi:hypothetical protein
MGEAVIYPIDILLALDTTRELQATDPRDKLYSLANLVDLGLEVDYSVPYRTLCKNSAATQILQRDDVGRLLAHAGRQGIANNLLPSWAPDWDLLLKSPQTASVSIDSKANQGFHQLLGTTPAHVSGDELTASGVQFDSIEETIHEEISDDAYMYHVLKFLFNMPLSEVLIDIVPDQPRNHLYITGIPLTMAVLRTFLAVTDIFREMHGGKRHIDMQSETFERIAAAFLFLIAQEQFRFEARPPLGFSPISGSLVPLHTVREVFFPQRTTRCPFPDILGTASVVRPDTDGGMYDMRALEKGTPFILNAKPRPLGHRTAAEKLRNTGA